MPTKTFIFVDRWRARLVKKKRKGRRKVIKGNARKEKQQFLAVKDVYLGNYATSRQYFTLNKTLGLILDYFFSQLILDGNKIWANQRQS